MVHKSKKAYLKKEKSQNELEEGEYKKISKKAKIIVRNLPFKNLSEKSVEEFFKQYGEIVEVKLLKKEDGKFVGCGFVQFRDISSAAKAIRYANLKELNGRKIVVDWALPKNTFIQKVQKLEEETDVKEIKKEDLSDEDIHFEIDRKPEKFDSNDEESEMDEKDENDEEGESEDDDDDEEQDDDDDDYDNYDNKDSYKKKLNSQSESLKNSSNDVVEGKTVFIRNVPFSATNEDLKECVERFGPVEYALICIDKLTEHSKGTAFVKFKDKESATQCIKNSMKLSLQNNPLTVTIAVSKENLEDKKNSKKQVKDSRNLYLIREGVIIAGSKAAVGISASDMAKRLQLEQWKSQILKNLNMIVSKTRLVVHNLPPTYDDIKLKQLFLKHSNPKAIIKEAKVMREKKKVDSKGNSVSKEVGFVSFTTHEDALTALRNINNNPSIFTPKKRPIVAFSIENRAVLNAKQRNLEKSRAKLGIINGENSDKLSKLNSKQRRFIKRRQKIIEKRREAKKEKMSEQAESVSEGGSKENSKRKRKNTQEGEPSEMPKKRKINSLDSTNSANSEAEPSQFTGIISEPGKKVKLRSRFKLKMQANVHNQVMKKDRRKRRERERKKMGSIKQAKQKKGKTKLMDDAKLSKLISKHRESIQNSSVFKKWYDN